MNTHAPEIFEPRPYDVPLPDRIAPVMVVGWFGMMLGTLGILTLPFAATAILSIFLGRGGEVADRDPLGVFMVISTTLGSGLAVMALVGGAACMRFRWWARPLMIFYGLTSVILGLVGIYAHARIVYLFNMGYSIPTYCYRMETSSEWVGWVAGTLFGAYTLWAMTRPSARRAFEQGETRD